jgi:hypothetical protein
LQALTLWRGHDAETPLALALINSTLIQTNLLAAETMSLVARLREDQPVPDEAQAGNLLTQSESLLSQAASVLESAQGN